MQNAILKQELTDFLNFLKKNNISISEAREAVENYVKNKPIEEATPNNETPESSSEAASPEANENNQQENQDNSEWGTSW